MVPASTGGSTGSGKRGGQKGGRLNVAWESLQKSAAYPNAITFSPSCDDAMQVAKGLLSVLFQLLTRGQAPEILQNLKTYVTEYCMSG
jgi:hypothetical protein